MVKLGLGVDDDDDEPITDEINADDIPALEEDGDEDEDKARMEEVD
jgi:hypothetical protein